MIKVVRGNPTPEELAAALAVVRARAAASSPPGDGSRAAAPAAWADPARLAARRLPAPGPKSWGRTYWPA